MDYTTDSPGYDPDDEEEDWPDDDRDDEYEYDWWEKEE